MVVTRTNINDTCFSLRRGWIHKKDFAILFKFMQTRKTLYINRSSHIVMLLIFLNMPIGLNSLVQYQSTPQNTITNGRESMSPITLLDSFENNNCCCIGICNCRHDCCELLTLGIDIKQPVDNRVKDNISKVFINSPACPNTLNSIQAVLLADYELLFTALSLLYPRDICSKAIFLKNIISENHSVLLYRPPKKGIRIS